MANQGGLFSIGHSNHSLEVFMELLRAYSVTALADVRSAPYSRHCPYFNKDPLAQSLKEHGIEYAYLGRELGGRPNDPTCVDEDGKVLYRVLAKTAMFRKGVERLKNGARNHRIAIMCSEREPLDCHRTLLISQALVEDHIDVGHIHGDGNLESHAAAMDRLLNLLGLPQEDLFHCKKQLLMEARVQQEKRIAFQRNGPSEVDARATR